jgi:hypothetical protein
MVTYTSQGVCLLFCMCTSSSMFCLFSLWSFRSCFAVSFYYSYLSLSTTSESCYSNCKVQILPFIYFILFLKFCFSPWIQGLIPIMCASDMFLLFTFSSFFVVFLIVVHIPCIIFLYNYTQFILSQNVAEHTYVLSNLFFYILWWAISLNFERFAFLVWASSLLQVCIFLLLCF